MDDSDNSLNAFLDASNDDEESFHLHRRGGPLHGGSSVFGSSVFGSSALDDGFQSRGRIGIGSGGQFDGDPLAHIDLDSLAPPPAVSPSKRCPESAAGSKKGFSSQNAKVKQLSEVSAISSRRGNGAEEKLRGSPMRYRSASPIEDSAKNSKSGKKSDSNSSKSSSSSPEPDPKDDAPSMFHTFLQDMQNSAEELRKRESEEEERKQQAAEEESRRKFAEEERKQKEQEEEERKRLEQEEEKRRQKEEKEKNRIEEIRLKEEEQILEEVKSKQAEEEQRRKEQEERAEEERRIIDEARNQKQADDDEICRKEDEERSSITGTQRMEKEESLLGDHLRVSSTREAQKLMDLSAQKQPEEAIAAEEWQRQQEELRQKFEEEQRSKIPDPSVEPSTNAEQNAACAAEERQKKQDELRKLYEEQQRAKTPEPAVGIAGSPLGDTLDLKERATLKSPSPSHSPSPQVAASPRTQSTPPPKNYPSPQVCTPRTNVMSEPALPQMNSQWPLRSPARSPSPQVATLSDSDPTAFLAAELTTPYRRQCPSHSPARSPSLQPAHSPARSPSPAEAGNAGKSLGSYPMMASVQLEPLAEQGSGTCTFAMNAFPTAQIGSGYSEKLSSPDGGLLHPRLAGYPDKLPNPHGELLHPRVARPNQEDQYLQVMAGHASVGSAFRQTTNATSVLLRSVLEDTAETHRGARVGDEAVTAEPIRERTCVGPTSFQKGWLQAETAKDQYINQLVAAKTQLEAEVVQLEGQVLCMQLDARRLRDSLSVANGASKEKDALLRDLAAKLEAAQANEAKVVVENETWARRLSPLTDELAGLREERKTLLQDLAYATSTSKLRVSYDASEAKAAEMVAAEEAVALAKALETTETMLRTYEKENENLADQNRQLRQASKLKREEVENRQLQLVADLNQARATAAANPASMRRVAELERELVLAKERVEEHARELERVRENKRQLERELLCGPASAQDDATAATKQQVADAMSAQKSAEMEATELREKLRYYAESQRQMEEDRRQVERLNDELRDLRSENSELRRRPTAKDANKRVAELRKQVDELSECLRKRNPDSILSLVKACEPAPEERKELRDLRSRIEELEAKLVERDTMYDRRVRGLRAQYDHLRHEYERRSEQAVPQGGQASTGADGRNAAPDREAVLTARIKDLERQVEHTKSYYLTKLRKREPLVPPKQIRPATTIIRETELQNCIRERDTRIEALMSTVQNLQAGQEVAKRENLGCEGVSSSQPTPALLRLFLASPEVPALVTISVELRAMAVAVRQRRFDEVASMARGLLMTLSSAEMAAKTWHQEGHGEGLSDSRPVGQDVLRLEAQPPFLDHVWVGWRKLTSQIISVAIGAQTRGPGEDGQPTTTTEDVCSDVTASLASLRACVEHVLRGLLCGHGTSRATARQAWPPGLTNPTAGVRVESVIPRLALERLREEIDSAGPAYATTILQDAEVHAGLDHKLPWNEFEGVLRRCSLADRLLPDFIDVADPDWSISIGELRQILSCDSSDLQSVCGSLARVLGRIRLAASRHDPPVSVLFHVMDVNCTGFLPRPVFLDALSKVRCSLNFEEKQQIATFFSPAVDPQWVCYMLLLHSVMPSRSEVEATIGSDRQARSNIKATNCVDELYVKGSSPNHSSTSEFGPTKVAAAVEHQPTFTHVPSTAIMGKLGELEVENLELRDTIRLMDVKIAELEEMLMKTPAQVVMRLQGEIAALESKIVEGRTKTNAAARKTEITLRSELDVVQHQNAALMRSLELKDLEISRYKFELESIIADLARIQKAKKAK